MKMIHFFAAVLLVTSIAYAKPVKKLKASAAALAPMTLKVVYGEKISFFYIIKDKDAARLEFSDNQGQRKSAPLTKADHEFLNQKLAKILGSNEISYCPRSYIQASGGTLPKQILGCLGSNNKVAQELQETVNVLSLLL